MRIEIIQGDCREIMAGMEADSIDAVVTDPPYGIGFMGKEWDTFSKANEAASKCLRKGLLLSVRPDGQVTYSKKASSSSWKAGSYDFSRNTEFQQWFTGWASELLRIAKPGCHVLCFGGTRTYHRLTCALEDAGWEIRDCLMWLYGSGFPKSHNLKGDWQGWGTALKPAWEPVVLARKPFKGTVANNVQEYGTGALNIDGCRIGTEERRNPEAGFIRRGRTDEEVFSQADKNKPDNPPHAVHGRWPANLLMDGPMLNSQSRFFYCAKTSRKERNVGCNGQANTHPTIKPLALMKYLCRLITPPGGVILDPFNGSGTTGVAAKELGFGYVGIEREAEYCEIARKRIAAVEPALMGAV